MSQAKPVAVVIDDEPQIRRFLSLALEAQGYTIYVARLRHKIEREPSQPRRLINEAGVGYRFASSARVRYAETRIGRAPAYR